MCMIDMLSTGTGDFGREQGRTARRKHECVDCCQAISPGEPYRRISGRYEAEWYSYAVCRGCAEVSTWIVDLCGGVLHGALWEDIHEHLECVDELKPGRYEALIDIVTRTKQLHLLPFGDPNHPQYDSWEA